MQTKLFAKHRMGKAKWGTKRRYMRSFKLNEISGVDNPAQPDALVLMTKRADAVEPQEFCKIAFREALQERQMERAFSDAFYEAFDGIWTLNDAFMEALKDRFNDGEQVAREYIEEVTDKALAAVAATRNLTKTGNPVGAFSKAVVEAVEVKKETPTMTLAELKKAIAAFLKSGGTDADITAIKKAATELDATSELPDSGALAISDAEKRADKAEAELKRRKKIDEMDDETRKHFDGLDDDAAAEFLGKSAEEQTALVKAANAEDPVVYTTKAGIAIRKSEGSTVVALAKQVDGLAAENAELKAEKVADGFEKSARTDYPNLPVASTAALLKAADAMSDTEAAEVKKGLKAQNDAVKGQFGFAGGAGPVVKHGNQGAQDELDQLVKSYAAEHNVDNAVALGKVLDTDRGSELYTEIEGSALDVPVNA